MITKMHKRHIFLAAATSALTLVGGCKRGTEAPEVTAEAAWVRLPVVPGQPGSAYFSLEGNTEGTTLTGISSPQVRRIEIHETREDAKGVSRMARLRNVEFPSRGALEFEPGGKHAMLFGLDSGLKPGDKVQLTFAFDMLPPITVDAEVRSATEDEHQGH